jgi:hypothetical protein
MNWTGEAQDRYAETWESLADWVEDHLKDPHVAAQALEQLRTAQRRAKLRPDAYPLRYVLRCLQTRVAPA